MSATSRAPAASWLAWLALFAFCFTVAVISSRLAAVSSSAALCSCVREFRLELPSAICSDAALIALAPSRILPTISRSDVIDALTASLTSANWPWYAPAIVATRSPAASAVTTRLISRSGVATPSISWFTPSTIAKVGP